MSGNPYEHPMRGLGIAVLAVLLFLVFLMLLTILVWWIA